MMKSMTIKKSTLLACLKTTLFQIQMMDDVNCGLTGNEDGPYDLVDCNSQGLTIGEQETEIQQSIDQVEQMEDSEYILIDANWLRDNL